MQVVFKILSVVLIAAAGLFPQVNELKFQKISVEQGLSQSVVVSILQDTRGFLWFATQDGLNRYDGYDFSIFKHSPSDSTTISDNYATFILQDKNGIHWVGTNGGGLNKFDVRSEKFTAFKNQAGDKRSLSNNNIRFMFEDANGNFWIATYGGGLNKLDRKHLIFTSYKNDARNPLSIADDRVFCVAGDNNNNLWIGTENGLDFFNPETGNFFHFKNKKENKFGLSSNFIRSLMVDENNLLYIGTDNGGLNILNLNEFYNLFNNNPQTAVDKIKFSVYKNSPKDINSIGGNSVNYIIKDKFGRIWLGLWAGGLSLFDQSKKIFSRYNYNPSNPNSLSQDDIITIYEDRTGIIWIGTYSGGISKLDRSWESFKLFRHDPNIPGSLSHNRVFAILQDKFGDLWVGTWGGGTYTFYVKAANPDGIWTKEPIALKINIIPPFYQTIIFNIIMLIAILLLLAAGVNWKTSRIKKQNKLLEKEVEKRTKELRELNATKDKFFSIIAHDLKGPFNFFLGSTSLLKEDINNLSKDEIKQIGSTLNSAAHKFYKLLDNLLAWARVQMGVLKPEPDNFVLLNSVNDIIKLMSDTAIKKEIEIKCNCNQIENVSVYADENMIGTVLRNLISNALKFTRKGGKVTVDFSKSENKLFISINDTGVGMSEMETENIFNLDKHRSQKGTENEEGAGLGLILCKEFIEKNGGTFEIKSEPNIGTTAIFSVPLSK